MEKMVGSAATLASVNSLTMRMIRKNKNLIKVMFTDNQVLRFRLSFAYILFQLEKLDLKMECGTVDQECRRPTWAAGAAYSKGHFSFQFLPPHYLKFRYIYRISKFGV
jgi:hypothetical protein